MQTNYNNILKEIKKVNLDSLAVELWIIKRKLISNKAQYETLFVKTNNDLKKHLKNIVKNRIETSNNVEPYQYITDDQDDSELLGCDAKGTDFYQIEKLLDANGQYQEIQEIGDLYNSWAYVISINDASKSQRIYAVRKIPEGWKIKRLERFISTIFQGRVLMGVEDDRIFRLDKKIDFIVYKQNVFIADKKQFESLLNFRVGMEKHGDEALNEMEKMDLFTDVTPLRNISKTNLKYLRRLCEIRNSRNYKNMTFISKMKALCEKHPGWNIDWKNNKINVTEDNVESIIRLLNNDRLYSELTEELFDVGVKKKIIS